MTSEIENFTQKFDPLLTFERVTFDYFGRQKVILLRTLFVTELCRSMCIVFGLKISIFFVGFTAMNVGKKSPKNCNFASKFNPLSTYMKVIFHTYRGQKSHFLLWERTGSLKRKHRCSKMIGL